MVDHRPHTSRAESRRTFLTAVGGSAAVLSSGCLGNSDDGNGDGDGSSDGGSGSGNVNFPTSEVAQIQFSAPGGGFDHYGRVMEPYWAEYLPGDPDVITESITGGGGRVGASQVYRSDDAHRMMFWYPSSLLPVQLVDDDVGYDLFEMQTVGAPVQGPNAMVLRQELGIEDWDQLVDQFTELNWATQGVGSSGHFGVILLLPYLDGVTVDDVNFIHYDGTSTAASGMETGEADALVVGSATSAYELTQSFEEIEYFTAFTSPDVGEEFWGDEVIHWSTEVDTIDLSEFNDVAGLLRFFAVSPGADEAHVEVLRDAWGKMMEDDDLYADAQEADRPLIDPADHTVVDDVFQLKWEAYQEFESIFEEVYG